MRKMRTQRERKQNIMRIVAWNLIACYQNYEEIIEEMREKISVVRLVKHENKDQENL